MMTFELGTVGAMLASAFINSPTQDVAEATLAVDRQLPDSAWVSLCRKELLRPHIEAVREQLGEQVGFTIEEPAGYFAGEIHDFNVLRQDNTEVRCQGVVIPGDTATNFAGIAVRAAWQMQADLRPEQLKQLLALALGDAVSAADGVALIAKLAPLEQQLSYLEKNLDTQALQLDQARAAVMQIYINGQDYDQALAIATECDAVACRRLIPMALQGKRQHEAEQAKDLSSYF